eukprot:TRINITY_DN6710_c2_g1_i1.p1 TRINITY_DN6710_c2_g1~~TRINITY_DN6710_c2_g1_i1.p1  ORF type:complete len:652 (-),score=187.02 TRINITY_DN6710_c2_g1_i1:47-2002(-)
MKEENFYLIDDDEDEEEENNHSYRKRKNEYLESTPKEDENLDNMLNKKQKIHNRAENTMLEKAYERYLFSNNVGFLKIKKERNEKNVDYKMEGEEEINDENNNVNNNNNNNTLSNEIIIEDKVTEIDITLNPIFMRTEETIEGNIENLKEELEIKLFAKCVDNIKRSNELLKKYKREIEEIENEEHRKKLNESSNLNISNSILSNSLILERSNSSFKKFEMNSLNEEERILLSILFSEESYSLEIWNKLNEALSTQNKEMLKKYGFLVGKLHGMLKKNFNKFKGLAFKWGSTRKRGPFTLLEDTKDDNQRGEQKDFCESIISDCYHLCSQDPRLVVPPSFFHVNQSEITPHEITSEKGILYVFQCQNSLISNIKKNEIAMKISPNQLTQNDIIIPPKTEFKLVHSSGDSNVEFRQLLQLIFKTAIPPTLDILIYREIEKEEASLHLEQIIVDSWNGSREAQCKLGSYYFWGKEGLQKNYEKAYIWLLKSALQGHPVAQNSIGAAFYQKGVVVPRDHNIAYEWFKKAAIQGNTKAQYNLALLYRHGRGVQRDYQMALYWYTIAASSGHVAAKNNIGYLYEHGYGVNKDFEEALKWYLRAAFLNNTKAKFNVGCFLLLGKGNIPKDPYTAREWRKVAAAEGDADAKRLLTQRF